MKICKTCNIEKPLNEFHKNNKNKPISICKICANKRSREYDALYRKTPKGMAYRAWGRMNARVENKNGLTSSYSNVKVLMTKQEFLNWAIPQYEEWLKKYPNIIPSVNRKNSNGHYEIDNIEIISWEDNSLLGLASALKSERLTNAEILSKRIIINCKKHNIDLNTIIELLQKQKNSTSP